jgi:hypothetical protein
MLDDPFANTQRQIQPTMCRVTLFKMCHDPQRMQIVIEAPSVLSQAPVESPLPRMSKRRMADIMHQRKRLRQILVQSEPDGRRPRDLCHLDRVRQSAAKVIGSAARKHLRLPCQPPERPRLHHPLAVTLKRCPARSRWRRRIDACRQRIVRLATHYALSKVIHHTVLLECNGWLQRHLKAKGHTGITGMSFLLQILT